MPLLLAAFAFPLVIFAADPARVTTSLAPEAGRLLVDVRGAPPPAPVFFSVQADHVVRVAAAEITGEIRLKLRVVQGRPEVLTLGLTGEGDVVDVSGTSLRGWAVRQGAGAGGPRYLDLQPQPAPPAADLPRPAPAELEVVVRTRLRSPAVPGATALLLVAPGDAVGFGARLSVRPDAGIDLRIAGATGATPIGDGLDFVFGGDSRIEVRLLPRGAAWAEADLVGAQLSGTVNEATGSVAFRLRGQLRATKAGARLRLLAGRAGLTGRSAGDGWLVELVALGGDRFAYDLVGTREGVAAVELNFAAAVREEGDWRAIEFAMPAGAIVPVHLDGLGDGVSFKPDAAVVPMAAPPGWRGFLPGNGVAALAWKPARASGQAALAFTSTEETEVRIGAGLLRQSARFAFRILQGTLAGVRLQLDGPGEILGVEGPSVVGWKVVPGETGRVLEVRFNRPMETQGALTIHSQAELGSWPARAEPIRCTPEGGVRHSGFVRIANAGAVRLEIADVNGLMQLAPAQFPGEPVEPAARQVFVYRFPSASYHYRVLAAQIRPEVNVSFIATHEMQETARVIDAAIELEVREAPLRDWMLRIPEDFAVVAVTGADVADYAAEGETAGGTRVLRVIFGRAIEGRQLLQLRLEKNQPAVAGGWRLAPLAFPGAKSVRGHVGAVATAGYRLAPARTDQLVEVPLSSFPRQTAGLQHAWRLREPDWSADLQVEALGQSVQADVFHLYSLRESMVTSSVLVNYFVVGAPANEWRLEVPAALGHVDITGQNARRDWRREGDQVIVPLHQPVLGAATLLITFEQPMSARGGVISPGQVRPLGVQSERGFVQVVSPLQVKHAVRRAEGALLKLEPLELPAEFRLLSSAPSLAVYHYTARPFALDLQVEWFTPGELEDQVIDFAHLASQVSRDGQVVTEVKYFVQTRGRKPLRFELPEGVKLWEARVDREVVHARADGSATLVPLPPRANASEPVEVGLRLGQPGRGDGTRVYLIAPRIAGAPTVVSEWLIRGERGRVLVPRERNTELAAPALTETGFEWISTRGALGTLVTLGLLGLGALLGGGTGWRVWPGLLAIALGAGGSLLLAGRALVERRPNLPELSFAATVVPAGETVTLALDNVPEWRALLVGWGLAAAVLGGALAVASRRLPIGSSLVRTAAGVVALLLIAAGLLAQRGGAAVFFAALSAAVLFGMLIPGLLLWRRDRREGDVAPGAGPAGAVTLLVLGGFLLGPGHLPSAQAASPVRAPAANLPRSHAPLAKIAPAPRLEAPAAAAGLPAGAAKPAQAIIQTWSIRGDRVFAEVEVTVRGGPGDSFVLLRAPAVLTSFDGDGLRVGKVERDGSVAYQIGPEREGTWTARARFELPLSDRLQPIALPTGPAAMQRVTVELDQPGWEIVSPMAVEVRPAAPGDPGRSGATLVFAPHAAPAIRLQPRQRDLATETTQYFVETANLFLPGPGVVNGCARVTVRPVQGRVPALELEIPEGFTVGDVGRGPVDAWRFDPRTRRLQVAIEPAQSTPFRFDVETQRGAGELPYPLTLAPLRARGAAGEVGTLALAFGGDAQPESVRPANLSAVNVQDFDATLLPAAREGQPAATLQQVWRYAAGPGQVELKVAPVAPEVRVTSRQVLSLDDDRVVLAAELRVAISRVGVFRLSLPVPGGLEIEAVSGPALYHWTEAGEGGRRVVTLHLNGRTLGEQAFHLTLTGAAPGAQAAWPFPRLAVREAARQTTEALVVPGKGIRVRAVDLGKVTPLDPRTVGGMQPGTLAFRLLAEDWVLRLGLETLEAWVTVQALTEATLREGQTLHRIALRYRVENAAVKSVRLRLPGLTGESARTVRATGPAVSDIVRLPASEGADLWAVRFQRGIAGETSVQIEYQDAAGRAADRESLAPPEFVGVRQAGQFVAVRSGGRLDVTAGPLPRGWTRVDWSAVPAVLLQPGDRSAPVFCFRVAEPEGPLAVAVRRHEVAGALKLRVTQGALLSLLAPAGECLTAADLQLDVLEKGTLRVRLPAAARLFNTFVNGDAVTPVREGDAWLFHVAPPAAGGRTARVRLVYAVPAGRGGTVVLAGPGLSVPLENVTWRVVLPPGYALDDYAGALRLQEAHSGGSFGLDHYVTAVTSKRSAEARETLSILQQAGSWLQKGEQDKAAEALSRVTSNGNNLDAAANEDARVQLRNLKTQQAVLGLNTRRQRLYFDHRGAAAPNAQLEQAANLNPFMQGRVNFDPRQADQLLLGNTADENAALRGIAARIVEQQLATEPAPGAIDVTLPERGRVVTFARSLQVDGSAPLELKLELGRITSVNTGLVVVLLLALAAIATIELHRRC